MMMVMKLFCIVPLLRKISAGESPGLDLTIPLPIDADLLSWKVNAFGWRDLYLYSQSSKYFLKNHSRGSSCHASKVFSTSQVKVTWDMPVRSRDILVSSRTPLVSMSRFPPYLQTFYEVLPFHQKCILGLILWMKADSIGWGKNVKHCNVVNKRKVTKEIQYCRSKGTTDPRVECSHQEIKSDHKLTKIQLQNISRPSASKSWPNLSLKIPTNVVTKLLFQNLDQGPASNTSGSKYWPKVSLKISTELQPSLEFTQVCPSKTIN